MSDPMREIGLLNVSAAQLKALAKKGGVDGFQPGATKLDVVRAMAGELESDDLDRLAANFMFAGQTAMSWIRLGTKSLDREALRKAIVAISEGDPFTDSLRPKVGNRPKVVEAKERDDGKIMLTFVVSKPLRPVLTNFEIRNVEEDHFFVAVIRPDLATVEIRSSHDRVRKTTTTFIADLAHQLDVEAKPVEISTSELKEFKIALGAKLARYRGKEQEGSPIDVRDLRKSEDCDDLDEVEEFQTETESCTPIHLNWTFDYEGETISIQVSRQQGSVWFRSSATEEMIDHVFSALRKVKGF